MKRKKVFTRDKFTCRYCKKVADEVKDYRNPYSGKMLIQVIDFSDWRGFEIDHKKPRSKGGTNDLRNLLTACAKCNNKKSTKSHKQFLLEITLTEIK